MDTGSGHQQERERLKLMAEVWNDVKRGAGWAVGFGAVVGTAFVLKRGAQPAMKSAMKGLLRLRTASAEMRSECRTSTRR